MVGFSSSKLFLVVGLVPVVCLGLGAAPGVAHAQSDPVPPAPSTEAAPDGDASETEPPAPPPTHSDWGFFLWFAGGFANGDAANPNLGVQEPRASMAGQMELSYRFGYVGVGLQQLNFRDDAPSSERVVNVYTGEESTIGASAETSAMGHFELGLAQVVRIGRRIGIRPGLGYGVSTPCRVSRSFEDCQDCDSELVLKGYRGGMYLRPRLGLFYRTSAVAAGLFASYQQFLVEVDHPGLNRTVQFGVIVGGGAGLEPF